MKIFLTLMTVLTLCIFLTVNATAEENEFVPEAELSSPGKEYNHAINVCPIAPVFGTYSMNYEYLLGQTHGMVARFEYESISDYSGGSKEAHAMGFMLNYRWHWSESMDSGFLGIYARDKIYNGIGKSDGTKFDFTITDMTLGLNIGKRWVCDNGFNMTVSLGYGISKIIDKTDPESASIESELTKFNDEYMSPLTGEISVGYAF